MAAKDKTRKQFPGSPSRLATQSKDAMTKLVAIIHFNMFHRAWWPGLQRRRWSGHKQTNWITSRKTGKLIVGGHSRY